MKRRSRHLKTLVATLALVIFGAGLALGQDLRVEYRGEVIDDTARSLGGVFALTFKLYQQADSEEPLWTEEHYVAVVDGEYTIELGGTETLDPELTDQEVFVAVEFLGEELLREPLTLSHVEDEAGDELPEIAGVELTHVTFADLADRSLVADQATYATECDTLAGRTVEDLDRYDELLARIEELEERLDQQSRSGSGRIGSSTTVLQRIGGEGGTRYTRMCPAGYIVIGARGAAGGYIDSIELVCAPIE